MDTCVKNFDSLSKTNSAGTFHCINFCHVTDARQKAKKVIPSGIYDLNLFI